MAEVLRPDEVAKLTLYQVRAIYFAPRDAQGKLQRLQRATTTATPGSYKDIFWRIWRRRGWTEEQIQARWEAKSNG